MKRLFPFGDRIGQPSSEVVLSSELLPAISSIFCAVLQSESAGAAAAVAVTERTRTAVSVNVIGRVVIDSRARGTSGGRLAHAERGDGHDGHAGGGDRSDRG